MRSLLLGRLWQLPLIVMAVFTITLTLAWAIPGNPLENPERSPPPEIAEQLLASYNLDDFWKFYGTYLYRASGLAYAMGDASGPYIFDLGPSLQYRDWTVNEIIAGALPVSAALGLLAIGLALVIGITTGVIGAAKPGGLLDLLTLLVALVGISLPSFVVGMALLLVFAVWIPLFPVAGWGTPGGAALPALTLSLPFAAYIARLTRMGMVEQMTSDHVRTARAKGAGELRVLLKHALRNALLPVLGFLGPATAAAMTGSFVVERVFSVPGMGVHFVNAVQNKDLFLIIGVVLVFSTLLVLLNLVVDILYRWADPRTRQA
ncbi:MAG: ABC transporter permease [Planctomycetota bacterium]